MSFETIKTIIEFNKAQPSIEADCLAKNECPDCAWPLRINLEGIKACPICERIFK